MWHSHSSYSITYFPQSGLYIFLELRYPLAVRLLCDEGIVEMIENCVHKHTHVHTSLRVSATLQCHDPMNSNVYVRNGIACTLERHITNDAVLGKKLLIYKITKKLHVAIFERDRN